MADYFEERDISANQSQEEMTAINSRNLMILLTNYNMFDEIGFPNQSAPPASKAVIKNLHEEKIENGGEQCQICLKEFEKDEVVKKLPCKHSFHSACIMAWLAKTNSCPLCRHELPTDNPFYEAYRKEKIRAKERVADLNNLHNSMFT